MRIALLAGLIVLGFGSLAWWRYSASDSSLAPAVGDGIDSQPEIAGVDSDDGGGPELLDARGESRESAMESRGASRLPGEPGSVEGGAVPLVWKWEDVEERLPQVMGCDNPEQDEALVQTAIGWPRDLSPETSAEHFAGVELTAQEISELEGAVRDINAEIEATARINVQELALIKRSIYESGGYSARKLEPGCDPPVVEGDLSSANFPGWQVTWPAITYTEYPHLRQGRITLAELKRERSVIVTTFLDRLQKTGEVHGGE